MATAWLRDALGRGNGSEKMKKYVLILGILCICCTGMMGQMTRNIPVDKTFSIGLKGGVNVPKMYYYQNPALMRLPQSNIFTPIGGVFLDVPLSRSVFFSPELMYVQRGTDMTYNHRSVVEHYSISTSYFDLRLPLELGWKIKPYFQPYVTIGVEAGMCLFGHIDFNRQYYDALFPRLMKQPNDAGLLLNDSITIAVDSANMSMIHVGAFVGVGVRSKVTIGGQDFLLKLSASFHQGFLDSYSPDEHSGSAQAVNVNAYKVTGERWPQGFEVTLGVAIPLENGFYDACSSFSKDRYRRHGRRGQAFGF